MDREQPMVKVSYRLYGDTLPMRCRGRPNRSHTSIQSEFFRISKRLSPRRVGTGRHTAPVLGPCPIWADRVQLAKKSRYRKTQTELRPGIGQTRWGDMVGSLSDMVCNSR